MKISIRLSFLSLFLGLVFLIGLLVIITNSLILNKTFHKSAEISLGHLAERISQQIRYHLNPLDERVIISANLIQKNIISPTDPQRFLQYLLRMIKDNPNIYATYWANHWGSLYYVQRYSDNLFLTEIMQPPHMIERLMDIHGNFVTPPKIVPPTFDIPSRPWYISAQKNKKLSRTLYLFNTFLDQPPIMGITSSAPVYDAKNNFQGVFALDMTLSNISNYFIHLKVTPNTVIFICDDQKRLIASSSPVQKTSQPASMTDKLNTIDQLTTPWASASYSQYQSNQKTIFSYQYHHQSYLAAYIRIPTFSNESWYVAIVIPESDLTYALHKVVFVSFFSTIGILLLSFILIGIVSKRISAPIEQLTHESEKIRNYEVETMTPINSHIKEIYLMQSAFNAMKSGLKSFRRYLPFSLVQQLIKSGVEAQVGGNEETLTFFFVDINHFTTTAEHLPPSDLMHYLSGYFELVDEIITRYQGTIDKFLGDGVMAFWNAPTCDEHHALHACQCALELNRALKDYNEKGKGVRPEINVHIGINTGTAIVGNVGSKERLNYTAISDAVNIAARILNLNKLYGTSTLVGQATREVTQHELEFRLVDFAAVKGRQQGIYLYELLGEKGMEHFSLSSNYQSLFQEAFSTYRQGYWEKAIVLFRELQTQFPNDYLPRLFIDRCKKLSKLAPDHWNGTWIMEEK